MTDAELVENAASGDRTAFLLLYERYRSGIFRFAYRLLSSQELAEDIVQDCFVSLIRDFRRFDPARGSLRTYLYAAARNLAFKQFRRMEHQVGVVDLQEVPDPSGGSDPYDRLLLQERSTAVRRAIESLNPLQREVLVLAEYENLPMTEIGLIVGADTGTVRVRLHRARSNLRKILEPILGEKCPMPFVEQI